MKASERWLSERIDALEDPCGMSEFRLRYASYVSRIDAAEARFKGCSEIARIGAASWVSAPLNWLDTPNHYAALADVACGIDQRAASGVSDTETTETIATWACETFGESGSDARVAARANEEMAELLRKCTAGVTGDAVLDEIADVVIVLARLANRNGGNIWKSVERKMSVNRKRVWKMDGTGHGYHVRDGSAASARAREGSKHG